MSPRILVVVLVAALFLGITAVSFSYDTHVRKEVLAAQGKGWRKTEAFQFHSAVRKWGDWPWLMVAGGAGLGVARLMRSRRWTRILVAAMVASTLAGMVVNLSRLTTGRTRPRASPEVAQGFYGPWSDGKLLIGNSKFNSFPSGHTATAFGFAWPVLFGSPLAGIPALMIAALIAWASIQLGAHHFSDIVVSILVSGIVSVFVWRWINRHGEATWHRIRNLRKRPG